jgi:hypothetical protein
MRRVLPWSSTGFPQFIHRLINRFGPVIAARHCKEQSNEAIQFLLRGACRRARIRVTRWMPIEVCALIDEAVKATSA